MIFLILMVALVFGMAVYLAVKIAKTRKAVELKSVDLLADLDALITKPVHFKFDGEAHTIPPLDVKDFMRAANALAVCDLIRAKPVTTEAELIDAFSGVFAIMCPTITRKKVEQMRHTQVAALFNLCLECIMGKAQMEKKNGNMLKPTA